MASFFSFPNPVNELAARTVAAGVVVLGAVTLLTQSWIPLAILAAGFVGRVLAGPRLSLLGFVAQRVVAPRLGPARLVPGPPKRFAQGIGATLTSAAVLAYALDAPTVAWVLVGLLLVAASLEAFAGFCLGCWIFGRLQRAGLIPADVCEACNNISLRRPAPAPTA
ncbi:DUF4395 domain-containing protein [Flavimobilis sp. GY10621]|uniref:DUF4395 domain-containing protein n=1 Tax=Flavimobilis rhizosphaerae TaxID=2775421 RepID=A0ABR9DL79_9MICO|nr:DUF4395 domain-containing protein [Flavimobilis rhizosphaerae]MBD9697895.1 DUF4395 domain-containing protein [Flavimobilis rhizosphaerae]